ncbi:MAG: branched-chain amino acid ABC transporter permease [Burkholderiaceae bacterium]|nr:branched-chain amino acid ABC transporter permease [Burkholderiaceae bacterium]
MDLQLILSQGVLGLINGSFYALLALGLSIIVGMLGIINFAHGAFYMTGAFLCWMMLEYLGVGYWPSLILVPLLMSFAAALLERSLLKPLYRIDPAYGLLLTFGVVLVLESAFRIAYGISGRPYRLPPEFSGAFDLGFMLLPKYRAWVVVASLTMCAVTILSIERTRLGSYLRAAIERPDLLETFGVNVPMMVTCTFAFGVALAAFAGVLAAPIYQVSPLMGAHLIIVVFAVVVIGGMGSIIGAVVTGPAVGLIEGMVKVVYPEAASVIVFIVMGLVLLFRPSGVFGKA